MGSGISTLTPITARPRAYPLAWCSKYNEAKGKPSDLENDRDHIDRIDRSTSYEEKRPAKQVILARSVLMLAGGNVLSAGGSRIKYRPHEVRANMRFYCSAVDAVDTLGLFAL